jgi:hypothetical protein
VDGDVLGGHGVVAHTAGHPDALEHATGSCAGTDGARLAVVAVGTVGGADAVEAVTLHHTGEALALGRAGHVDLVAGGERVDGQLLADRVRRGVGGADLGHVAARGDPGLLELAGGRLGDLATVDLAEPDLDGVVAVALGLADLGHDVRGRRDDGDRDDPVVVVPHLGHAELGAQQALHVSFNSHVRSLRA